MSNFGCRKLFDFSKNMVNLLVQPSRGAQTRFPAHFPVVPFKLKPDKLNVGMTGSTYQTTIKRKRVVPDINVPVLTEKPVECLKWANWKMLRDIRRRYVYSYHHALSNNYVTLMRNNILPTTIKVSR